MPSFQSTMSAEEKTRVKSVLSADNKILMASVARIYYAHPDPNTWTFSGEQGGLAFVKDKTNGLYYFKLVDLQGTRGVIWEHELYEDFTLNEDRPFFHSFAGDECMIGLVYTDEGEASSFLKVVTKKKAAIGKAKTRAAQKKTKSGSKGGKILKSLISGPQAGSFRHVSHMGYDPDKGFTSDNVDPSWMTFLNQLESHGVDAALIAENMDFIKDFVRDAQQPKPKTSKSRSTDANAAKKSSAPTSPQSKPPAPQAPATRKKSQRSSTQKPPPPVPRRGHTQSDSVTSVSSPATDASPSKSSVPPPPPPPPVAPAVPVATTAPTAPVAVASTPTPPPPSRAPPPVAAPPPPPAPPSRPAVPSVAPPLPPGRPSASNGATASSPSPQPVSVPPPPPPPPATTAPPPPPPPPPPVTTAPPPPPPPPAGVPPPPPPPAVATSIPASQTGRNALLESIQGKGIHSLRKTNGPNESVAPGLGRVAGSPAPQSPSPAEDAAAAGGGDLAAALAAALTQRNKKLGDSDDEDDEEEWD